jgi:hypothetical protein
VKSLKSTCTLYFALGSCALELLSKTQKSSTTFTLKKKKIGLATTLVEHREKAPIYYFLNFFFMISRQLKQSDSKRDFGLG